ncbi:MAG TPA: hemerythrin domain-containing protein [Thiobacillus sp.]
MSTILEFLGGDHRMCDDLFASAEETVGQKNWDGAQKLFDQFHASMNHHLAMEENVLFPAFEAQTGTTAGPTHVMRMEHEHMRELMQNMAHAVSKTDVEGYLGLSETLNMLMQQHNLKEENMLYPMTDQALAGERDQLLHAMQAVTP